MPLSGLVEDRFVDAAVLRAGERGHSEREAEEEPEAGAPGAGGS